jgi:hypothetical protein
MRSAPGPPSIRQPDYWWYRARSDLLKQVLDPYVGSPSRLLDVGSADGPSVGWLTAAHKISLDVDPRGLQPPAGVCGSVLALPFEDASFDVVGAFDVIEHCDPEDDALRELYRVLAPGGRLLASVPAYQWAWTDHDVANGHHRDPRWPDPPFPGDLRGRQMHAHDYVGPGGFENQSVVVLGMGNSAMDIAVELSTVARRVYLASRRGAHIVPKFAMGQPIDTFNTALPVPWAVKRALFSLIVRRTIGRPQDVGLPTPDHRLGEAHPTVSQRITESVRAGAVIPKPNIASLAGERVRFTDGSEVEAEVIVYCTGYNIRFPFLDRDVIDPVDNRVDLFHQVFAPGVPNLAFIGLVQPFGALMPVAEAQSAWVADYLAGTYRLPSHEVMRSQISRERTARERQFVASPRHTMEIDFYSYLRGLRRERRRGSDARAVVTAA